MEQTLDLLSSIESSSRGLLFCRSGTTRRPSRTFDTYRCPNQEVTKTRSWAQRSSARRQHILAIMSGGAPKKPSSYRLVQEHLESFLAQVEAEGGSGLPEFVKAEFD